MGSQGILKFSPCSKVSVTTVGSDSSWKLWCLFSGLAGLVACTQAPVNDYFCEAYSQESGAQFYKQQIVQLKNDRFCIWGRHDAPLCVEPNQDTSTPWRAQGKHTQVREWAKLKAAKDTWVMEVEQASRSADDAQNTNETTRSTMRYEFHQKNTTLTWTTDETTPPTVYTCKPWVKRAWWQIY